MNCDEAFDALTDPTLRDGESLKRHLERCPRCAQMQQTLEPALGLFRPRTDSDPVDQYEAGTEAAELNYTSRQGDKLSLSPEAVRIAEQTAENLAQQSGRKHFNGFFSAVMKYAAVFLVGSAVTVGAVFVHSKMQSTGEVLDSRPVSQCLWQRRTESRPAPEPAGRNLTMSCVACHLPGTRE